MFKDGLALNWLVAALFVVNRTYSETGQVRLSTTDPYDEPIVEFNLLSDERDLIRLMEGFQNGLIQQPDPSGISKESLLQFMVIR